MRVAPLRVTFPGGRRYLLVALVIVILCGCGKAGEQTATEIGPPLVKGLPTLPPYDDTLSSPPLEFYRDPNEIVMHEYARVEHGPTDLGAHECFN